MKKEITRRDVIRVGGVVFASGTMGALARLLAGCGGARTSNSGSTTNTSTATGSCVESASVTRGPYFVDDRTDANISGDVVDASIPERSDIRADSEGSGGTQRGLTLTLKITVGAYNTSTRACTAISGAQVHIWHCNSQGVYSDVQAGSNENGANLVGEDFLRGYQFTDANGLVTFTTIYPGWYSGRAVHIHVKVRLFDTSGKVTTEATTQLFFDDTTTDAVYSANSQYSRSTARDTLNAMDSVYSEESPVLLVNLTGSAATNYTGTISIGVIEGSIYGG